MVDHSELMASVLVNTLAGDVGTGPNMSGLPTYQELSFALASIDLMAEPADAFTFLCLESRFFCRPGMDFTLPISLNVAWQ